MMQRVTLALAVLGAFVASLLAGCQGISQRSSSFMPASNGLPLASSYGVIHSFGPTEGNTPQASPIVDVAGQLYGATVYGGDSNACGSGCGTIYRLLHDSHGWKETTLFSFDLNQCCAYPGTPLVADASGNLYGATDVGGNLGVAYGLFHGAHALQFRVLHNFQGNHDGAQPRTSLIFDKRGNLYGTTIVGGTGGSGGNGTVYELTRSGSKWTETIVHRFTLLKSGANPSGPVMFGRDGDLYGETVDGGNSSCAGSAEQGCGVVFRLAPAAKGEWTESVLHAFDGIDGFVPSGGIVADAAGNLYGSTQFGGGPSRTGYGEIFELAHRARGLWSFSVIHKFTGSAASAGSVPLGTMAFDAAGNLYGTAYNGGNLTSKCIFGYNHGCGVVFRLAPGSHHGWKYSLLHSFDNTPDGALPTGVVLSADDKLYGTTIGGGKLALGAAFEVTP
jgi:uncharacterized repeat protein (TIGR03803 family)